MQGVFGLDPEPSAINLHDGKEASIWPFLGEVTQAGQIQQHQKMASTVGLGYGSLADHYDLSRAINDFTFETPESPPSSSDDESSSSTLDGGSSASSSPPDLSPKRSFALLTLDTSGPEIAASPPALISRPWEQYLPTTTPPHLRAFTLSSRRPKSNRLARLQLARNTEPPKVFPTQAEPQLLDPVETSSTSGGLNIFDNNADLNDTSFLLPSPLSPCMPANFPRAPQNSPDEAYFPSSATSAPIPIPGISDKNRSSQHEGAEETEPEMQEKPAVITKTCRRTPYYPPNASQTEDRSRVYMNRGPHYIANWTPLSSLPIEAQRRIERSMIKFTAPETPEEK